LIHKFKYILSFLLLLSLIGIGENISDSRLRLKNSKETEWLSKTRLNEKESKCFSYIQYIDVTTSFLNIKPWSNENIICYNHTTGVHFISLKKMFCEIDLINLIINKSYTPRKSIKNHNFSC